ncbi:MAG: hypothetical protein JW709_09135 [Sedimentisphaerales bacterium]|nr:hypothetical protein [Sedimentisphaerales bacterium]
MTETLESFVAKLQSDGVEAGRKAAQDIRTQAEQEAEKIVQDARQKAKKIVEQAEKEAQTTLERAQTELKLACRDIVLNLRNTIGGCIRQIMVGPVEERLNEPEFLTSLLHDLVVQYARADCDHRADIKINLNNEMLWQLADWVIAKLRKTAQEHNASVDIKGSLNRMGFEYSVTGGTVEVTGESMVTLLQELVGPKMRELLNETLFGKQATT